MKMPYFKIKDAFNETRDSFSYGSGSEKITSTAKLISKSVANVGLFAVEMGIDVIKKAPERAGDKATELLDKKSSVMTEDQITKAKEIAENGKEIRDFRLREEIIEREEKRKEDLRLEIEKELASRK